MSPATKIGIAVVTALAIGGAGIGIAAAQTAGTETATPAAATSTPVDDASTPAQDSTEPAATPDGSTGDGRKCPDKHGAEPSAGTQPSAGERSGSSTAL